MKKKRLVLIHPANHGRPGMGNVRMLRYPPLALAENLRIIAQLIRADLGVRIYVTELGGDGFGGFDNHANQAANHASLLHHLSESLAAFVDDLNRAGLLDRVLLMTYSEFGRTVGPLTAAAGRDRTQ